MKELSLKERLVRYMQKRHSEFVASGDLQRLVAQHTSYTPRTTVRRLEELAAAGELEVEYRKGHSWYRIAPQAKFEPSRGMSKDDYIAYGREQVALFDK